MMATLALSLLLTSCGSKDAADTNQEPAASGESAAEPEPQANYLDACKLKMTSPEAREWQTVWDPRGQILLGEGPSTVHSTYWAGDDERESLINAKAPPLEVTCSFNSAVGDPEIMLSIEGRGGLTEADVPHGPGTYPIVPRSSAADAPKGFWVWPLLLGTSMFEASTGSITITRFDDKGAAGSFRFEAKEVATGDRTLVIEGTFDMPCRGGTTELKCTAGKAIVD